ncbi:MAG: protein-methionine-sulfoxide reductase catalytic subunit MsrP [Gammaproteobacteria bacterium]|nr:protein-methionine-sulfoxide reductase catalytic subunit MsrP [Gammaproteobacteria bacterium]MDP2141889.1 protein-methionine-sulfoxide reductase catalytic subunit MsrP [Gammaproteobacteria bacterium]MDP2347229.1 protein-methionine-sulfoxide reductase catalytic subunit MsrP [Gammaproteobacteria bacterium]
MLIKSSQDIPSSEITSESIYHQRRHFMTGSLGLATGALVSGLLPARVDAAAGDGLRARAPADLERAAPADWWEGKFESIKPVEAGGDFYTGEPLTPYRDVISYNNFYEFGTDKGDPVANSGAFKADPWSVAMEGEVDKPGVYTLEDILKPHTLEERIYRLRCVERWSMVIPWVGFPLADLIRRFQPTSKAKYVEFLTLLDPESMPGQRSRFTTINWPYREGLRIDEATHPLAFLAVGVYGNYMPPQNGAPIRLVVPWKYGFKSIKSIVKIRFTESEPATSWNMLAANEYGFYANVNPEVHHPRWRQDMETRLPQTLFSNSRIPTLPFNGYGEQVASLYSGMDLSRYY